MAEAPATFKARATAHVRVVAPLASDVDTDSNDDDAALSPRSRAAAARRRRERREKDAVERRRRRRASEGDAAQRSALAGDADADAGVAKRVPAWDRTHIRSLASAVDYSTVETPELTPLPVVPFKPPSRPLPGTMTAIPALPAPSRRAAARRNAQDRRLKRVSSPV
jgi:hypothetical protein